MKEYKVNLMVNGGEYCKIIKVKCNNLVEVNEQTLKADDVVLEFDEPCFILNES